MQVKIRHNAKKSVTRLNMLYFNTDTTNTTFEATDISSKTMTTSFFPRASSLMGGVPIGLAKAALISSALIAGRL